MSAPRLAVAAKPKPLPLTTCVRVGHRMSPVKSPLGVAWVCRRCARTELPEEGT